MIVLSLLSLLAALAVILLAGSALLRLLAGGDLEKTPPLERYGLWFLLGSGYVSLALFVAGFAFRYVPLVAVVCAGAVALFFWSRRVPLAPRVREPWRKAEWLVLAVFAGQAIFIAWWTPQVALGWDGLILWEAKARSAFAHGGALPISYLNNPPVSWGHARYPLYLPYVQDWLYLWLGRADQAWVRVYGPMMYVAGILVLVGSAQRLGVSRLGALIAGAVFFFVPYCLTGLWNVLSGYADFPLGVFYLAAASRLPGFVRTVSGSDLRLFAVLAGLTGWVKQEGFYLWAILIGIGGLMLLRHGRWKAALGIAIPGIIIGGGFKVFLKVIGAPADPFYHPPTWGNLHTFSDRILPVMQSLASELFHFELWSLLWIGMLLALLAMLLRRQWTQVFAIGLAIGIPLFFFIWPFVLSALDSYVIHMEFAVPRLLMQIAPTAMLAIALAPPRPLMRERWTMDDGR